MSWSTVYYVVGGILVAIGLAGAAYSQWMLMTHHRSDDK